MLLARLFVIAAPSVRLPLLLSPCVSHPLLAPSLPVRVGFRVGVVNHLLPRSPPPPPRPSDGVLLSFRLVAVLPGCGGFLRYGCARPPAGTGVNAEALGTVRANVRGPRDRRPRAEGPRVDCRGTEDEDRGTRFRSAAASLCSATTLSRRAHRRLCMLRRCRPTSNQAKPRKICFPEWQRYSSAGTRVHMYWGERGGTERTSKETRCGR